MSIDYFVSRFWRVASIIGFGVTLLFIYRGLPDPTAVHFGESGRGDGFLPKEEVFYLVAGVVIFINVLILLLAKNFEKIPNVNNLLVVSLFKSKGEIHVKSTIIHWFHLLAAALNTYLIFVLRVLLLLNDERTFGQDFSYIVWVGYAFLILWILYLPVRLFFSPDWKEE